MDVPALWDRRKAITVRSVIAAVSAAGMCLGLTSCSRWELKEEGRPAQESAAADAALTAADFKEVAAVFGQALVEGDYNAAYDLTSGRLHKRMSEKAFAQACSDAVAQFGTAERLGPVAIELTDGLDGDAASQQYGFPKEIPDDDRLAWVHASLALEVDGEEILRCYDCWMLLENDGGKARVGHFNFTFCGD